MFSVQNILGAELPAGEHTCHQWAVIWMWWFTSVAWEDDWLCQQNPCHIAHHTLDVSLHYLAKCKRTKLAKFCCVSYNNTCLIFITLTNNICIIGVKLNAQKVFLSHKFTRKDICAAHQLRHRWHARHRSSAASIHWRHELARPAAAFLPYFCRQSGSDLYCWVAKGLVNWKQVSRFRRLIVPRARWAGTLPCWKIKNSP